MELNEQKLGAIDNLNPKYIFQTDITKGKGTKKEDADERP